MNGPSLSGQAPGGTVALKTVYLHVTRACNLTCSYCYFSAGDPSPDEMTSREFNALWPEIVKLRPGKVVFTGGEPLLRRDIADLLSGLKQADGDHRVIRSLNTNGLRVTRELARGLVGLADEVCVSLDALRDRNDALRGQGSFDRAVHALECFHAAGFEPKVLITITSAGLPDLDGLLGFLREREISRFNFNALRVAGRGEGLTQLMADPEEARAVVLNAWKRQYPDSAPPPSRSPEAQTHCGVGNFLNIMPNGDVFPCHVLTGDAFFCGSARRQRLSDICRGGGLLGRLASLDFVRLAARDGRVAPIALPAGCMGDVYSKTKDLPVWRDILGC
jgi:MoaA/NifB/PqqE/SkfB family radical SAM enzyme